ncbi:TetR/AcrR family transcriptional regulator [Corallincola platygyrae]|uniref:TetR/AcrR family transcriptional regulator n=1 Tax=Corallincola platygyrae TaxID=1193278 RepID=A0ABW4XKA3_9GAMM
MTDKRALLTDSALQLFYEKGINSVGINEVLKVSGVAKKTLYNHFDSKEALVLATLEARDQIFLGWLAKRLSEASSNAELVEALFASLTDWFNSRVPELPPFRGCFFINSSIECGETSKAVSIYCQTHKAKVRELIENQLAEPNASLLDALCLLKEGAIVSAYVSQDLEAANKAVPLAMAFV